MIYYNEWEAYPAQWLRNMMNEGLIPSGVVDESDIRDVKPRVVAGTSHFFAGIGGWPIALRMAGWPDDAPVWTASLRKRHRPSSRSAIHPQRLRRHPRRHP